MKHETDMDASQHILVCLSSAPSNARIISAAARMAAAAGGRFTALFVETPDFSAALPEDKQRLQENRRMAQKLGAEVQTVLGDDVAFQIAEFARLSGVTTIVLGRSAASGNRILGRAPLTDRLIAYAPQIDIHIIPDHSNDPSYRPRAAIRGSDILIDAAKSAAILMLATLLGLLFDHLGFTDANIIMVYILGVLLISVATRHLVYSMVSSVASVMIFNYVFTSPRFSFTAYETGYPVTFIVMLLTAMITGSFAMRYKEQARQAARIAQRTRILFDTGKQLSGVGSREEILRALAGQVTKLLERDIVIYDASQGVLGPAQPYPCSGTEGRVFGESREREAAQWTYAHNHFAGATTHIFPECSCIYFAIRVNERVYGVLGVDVKSNPLDASEHDILLSILGEGALALENEKNAREKEETAIVARNEQMRANLLRSISHDLRTPLTTISGNAGSLLRSGDQFDLETQRQLYADIYDDAQWLIKLVENLLASTRIEEGRMTLRRSTELLGEIAEEALMHVRAPEHSITLVGGDELLLVRADAQLLMQVIVNLVENAVRYTPAGSHVTLTLRRDGAMAQVEVADDGQGIPDAEKSRVFEKFYCGARKEKIADNRRSVGLGLYLCRAIVQAHGGEISVRDRCPHGAVFTFTLPLEEVEIHEPVSCSGG